MSQYRLVQCIKLIDKALNRYKKKLGDENGTIYGIEMLVEDAVSMLHLDLLLVWCT